VGRRSTARSPSTPDRSPQTASATPARTRPSARPAPMPVCRPMRPLTFMISQRRGPLFSECETRLVEFLGNPQRLLKETSQRSV